MEFLKLIVQGIKEVFSSNSSTGVKTNRATETIPQHLAGNPDPVGDGFESNRNTLNELRTKMLNLANK